MKSLYIIAALAAFNFAEAQTTMSLKEFKGITVGENMKVKLVKSTDDKLVTTNESDEAKISYENGLLILKGYDSEATLYYKGNLETIIVGEDAILSGDDEITTKELKLIVGDDTVVQLYVNVQKLSTVAKDDAVLTLSGKATDHDAVFKDDAVFKGTNLLTATTTIKLFADAAASITAKDAVTAAVGNDGSLKIHGNPKNVVQSKGDDASIVVVK